MEKNCNVPFEIQLLEQHKKRLSIDEICNLLINYDSPKMSHKDRWTAYIQSPCVLPQKPKKGKSFKSFRKFLERFALFQILY